MNGSSSLRYTGNGAVPQRRLRGSPPRSVRRRILDEQGQPVEGAELGVKGAGQPLGVSDAFGRVAVMLWKTPISRLTINSKEFNPYDFDFGCEDSCPVEREIRLTRVPRK